MTTSTTLTKDLSSNIGKIAVTIAFAFVMCGVSVRPVVADNDDHHQGGQHHDKRSYRDRRAWHSHSRHEHQPDVSYYYAPSPYVYYAPPPVVYAPPPPSWGIDLFFPLRIR